MVDHNVGIAFAIVIGSGSATMLGAALVFFPRLVRYANRLTLAGALGLSAGVMTYVSFVEIFRKSINAFVLGGLSNDRAYIYATICFFGGVVVMICLNFAVTVLLRGHHSHDAPLETSNTTTDIEKDADMQSKAQEKEISPCVCCSDDPVGDIERIKGMVLDIETRQGTEHLNENEDSFQEHDEEAKEMEPDTIDEVCSKASHGSKNSIEAKRILSTSINTAVAIALHNFPEGLATFMSSLHDPKVGSVLAIAIAIHNIPEGICVALPIYYATGNRWKAFFWASISGLSEPFAALLGWLVLARFISSISFGITFGIVAGMMVIISVRELIPTAHRYDPDDKVVTYSFIAGMTIMALSLLLFLL